MRLKNAFFTITLLFFHYFFVSAQSSTLVNIQTVDPTIRIEIVYATDKNFTGTVIYKSCQCFVLEPVAQALRAVQKELAKQGLGLKIWDGYRPLSAQWKLWEICPDTRYVSDPRKGGRHTRGTAVDVTLITLKTGKELRMPTGFDDFTEKAWSNYPGAPPEALKNRQILHNAMKKHGFTPLETEWWHFDYKNWQECPVLDVQI